MQQRAKGIDGPIIATKLADGSTHVKTNRRWTSEKARSEKPLPAGIHSGRRSEAAPHSLASAGKALRASQTHPHLSRFGRDHADPVPCVAECGRADQPGFSAGADERSGRLWTGRKALPQPLTGRSIFVGCKCLRGSIGRWWDVTGICEDLRSPANQANLNGSRRFRRGRHPLNSLRRMSSHVMMASNRAFPPE